ncbi:eCIS core domain-containing protein [Streptomyces cellostaticus]|uniref:eCIS core domain-containing protein n=1 Tax=Streptomyces cellostaticus TaxID=67285 RepID=UPI00099E9E56|nr:DUF4157 domain-containing protein [Streptomyces cellostaticus]GHI09573.1 hypothetical protein Scel_78940 [Streptomyces cellostaticus]
MNSRSQDARAEQAAEQRRRKRKERAAKSRAPEPKNIVSGAGQPLDPGVRRELEEQLGHDLGRVRLHTGRDAGRLTELLGADAVAVGQDILFREGAFKPGTDEGRRLLAHELLHTVQNPHGLGALRAGREPGAVSLPQQAIEREAESAAQRLVRPQAEPSAPEVEEGRATPGWLRYATVDADRMRTEAVDPAALVDRLAGGLLRSLRGDPADLSGRVRMQLARMSPQLQDSVLDRLEVRLLTPEFDRLLELAEQAGESGAPELQPARAPEVEPDLFELLGVERLHWQQGQDSGRGAQDRKAADTREERQEARDRDEKYGSDRSRARADAAVEDQEAAQRTEQEDEREHSRQQAGQKQRQEDENQAADRARVDQASDERAQARQDGTEQARQERKAQRDREEQDPAQAGAPGADKRWRQEQATQPAAGAGREALDPKAKGQPGPVRPEKVDEQAAQPDSALSEHGLNEKDEDEEQPREEERPLGLEAGADAEVAGREEQPGRSGEAAHLPVIKPEDHLPDSDPDLSAVPTADKLTPGAAEPAAPTFPTPPPTRAERIEQEREKQEQEEDEDSTGPDAKAPGQDEGPVEGEAPQPEGGPVAQAAEGDEKDLQADQPTDQEVGPDPGTTDKESQEPEPEQPSAQEDTADSADSAQEQQGDAGVSADGRQEQQEEQDRTRQEARPQASAPAEAAARVVRPAGAPTPRTPVEDRNPSPAVRRDVEPPRPQREAPAARSAVPKESGPGAAPRGGRVGESERAGPTTGAGPGAAPSAAQAAVGPAAEQTDNPGPLGAPEGAQPQPEASLEKDGGGCAPPEPAPEKDDGAQSGCGGGGGAATEDKEKAEEPADVSGQDPKAAVQTVSRLAPDQAAAAMPGVGRAVDKKVGDEQQRLAAGPPTRERPSGAPQTRSAPPTAAAPAAEVTGSVEKLGPEDQGDKQQAKGSEKAQGQNPAEDVAPPPPPVAAELNADEAKNVEAAADSVPTSDPALKNRTVGPAPKIRLEGASDPKRTDDQAKALKDKQNDIHRTGRDDAAKPMGEDQIFPDAPRERLVGKAAVPGGGKGVHLQAGTAPKAGVGAVARQEKGTEIDAGAGRAQGDLTAKEKEHQQGEQQAKREKQDEIDREVARNTEQQTGERGRVAGEVQQQREQWRTEQDKKIEDADTKSEEEHATKNKEIVKARDDKDKEIEGRKDQDNRKIDAEREKSEQEAKKKKEEKKPSGGFFGWIADKVKSFFNALLEAVTAVFEAARKAVNGIIDTFKDWADKAIDFVRDLAISAINALADALIAIGDVLLAAFPELRDRFRKAIEGLRDRAIATVNRLADDLKKGVNALLDALAAGLNKLLDVLEAGLKAVIQAYQSIILGAIKFAQAAIEALGKFAALVADIAPDPGGWLSKAGSSAKTGITDHLWGAVKVAVKQWFDTKVEGILGLGKTIIDVLVKGCVSVKQMGKMAWDAIVASLPMMIATLVIEKVVSMLVPAAGAILTIVQGLMAAWQSLSSILSAFSKFWAYLKAVKAGPAACLFAEAVAAGVVALLDLITNFLLARLSSAAKGVGKRLKAMAQKITEGLKKLGRGARKAAGEAVNKARDALRNARERVGAPARAERPTGKPSPDPKSPPKPKDHATPKSPAKPEPTATGPKEAPGGPVREGTPDRPKDAPGESPKNRTPDREQERDGGARDRDTPKDKDNGPRRVPRKKKEIEGPKPVKPKKPKSPLGRALAKAKGAVKSALTKVRNAGRTLGRKLKNSKLGRSLENGASKLRDLFKKKRDRLREDWKKRAEQRKRNRDRRKRDEKSHDSKQERLDRAIPRVRRILAVLLKRGIPDRILRPTLDAISRFYRLTSLTATGDPVVDFDAKLNPERDPGIDGFRVRPSEKEAPSEDVEQAETSDQQIEETEQQAPAGRAPKGTPDPTASKKGTVVYDKDKTDKEEEDKNPRPYSRMKVYAKQPSTGMWHIGQVESVAKTTFSFYGHGKEGPAEFQVTIKNKRSWSKISKPGNFKYGRSFEAIRNSAPWSQYEPDARQSLNYRKAYRFTNPGGRKWNWHHIHEQVANGPNTVRNLAYSRDYANQEFNVWMARKQPVTLAPDGTLLPSTGNKSVRNFLRDSGASPETHRKWGLACIQQLGYQIDLLEKGRGPFQQIRK